MYTDQGRVIGVLMTYSNTSTNPKDHVIQLASWLAKFYNVQKSVHACGYYIQDILRVSSRGGCLKQGVWGHSS